MSTVNNTTIAANRADWLRLRNKGIGGSDASAVMGQNPWKTNVELWEEKTGRRQPAYLDDNPLVKYGKNAEEHLRKLFELDFPEYEVFYEDFNNQSHPSYEWLKGSFDGELKDKRTGEYGILEIKTGEINSRLAASKWDNQIPINYLWQVLHYLLVKPKFTFVVVKAQLKTIKEDDIRLDTRHYMLRRSDFTEQLDQLFKAEQEFWQCIVTDTPPKLILTL